MTIISHDDTRNKDWSKGSIGARLLTQMGWTQGTGLGKRRSGTAVPLRALRQSREAAGIGSKASDTTGSQGWNRTTDGFASVLQNLQEQHGTAATAGGGGVTCDAAGEMIQKKKKKKQLVLAKNKVTAGYSRKMREAKDLKNKSQADMAAIFGGVPQAFAAKGASSESFKKKKTKRKRDISSPPVGTTDTETEGKQDNDETEPVADDETKITSCNAKKEKKKSKKNKKKSKKSNSSNDEIKDDDKDDNDEEKPKKKRKKDKK